MRKLHDIIRRCKDEYNFYLFWVEHNIFLAMPLEIKYNGFKRNDAMIRKKRMFTTVEEWSSAYDSYYGGIRQISQKLHEISLTKGKAFETWLQDYKKYSKQMRQMYQKETDFIQEYLQYYIDHPSHWQKEEAASLLTYLFINCMRLEDTHMIYAAALSLLEYYSSRQNRVAEMKCYYILAICLHDLDVFHFHKEILQYCEMVIVRYEELYDTLSDMEKSYGLSIYDLLSVCRYEMLHADEQFSSFLKEVILPEQEHAIAMVERFMREADMTKPYNAVLPLIRSNMLSSFSDLAIKLQKKAYTSDIADYMYEKSKMLCGSYTDKGTPEEIHERISYLMSIRVHEQLPEDMLYAVMKQEMERLPSSITGKNFNYDNSLIEVWICILNSLRTLIQEGHEEYRAFFEEQLDRFAQVLASIPFGKKLEHIADTAIYDFVCSQLSYFHDDEKVLAYVLRLLVFRQVQTGIHSLMVSDAASMITQAMLRSRADLLIGQLNCMSEEEVQHKAAQFLEYIRIGALLHDIGKVCCSSVVNMQYRRLSAVEYKTIQFHPQSSAEILLRIPQLACFYDMAVGHHKSYDGKSGYPKDFHIEASPQKIFIDMIAICDSLDAATDSYGRNYAKAKKFETVVRELRSRAGTQYSGVIVDLICEDEALRSQLKDLLENRRDEACRKTFWILNADIKDIAAAIRKTSCWRNG